jgi:hypothetical protein
MLMWALAPVFAAAVVLAVVGLGTGWLCGLVTDDR